nr:Proline transporter 1 [Ipomoea batatas]
MKADRPNPSSSGKQDRILAAASTGFLTSTLGTITVSSPFSIEAFTSSIFAFSGSRNLLRNLPLLRSTRPGRSALNTWASGVSFQSIRALAKADVSPAEAPGAFATALENGNPWKGSHRSREKGSKMLLRRVPKMLGIKDIFLNE